MKNEKPNFNSAAEVMDYVDERLDAIAHRLRALVGKMGLRCASFQHRTTIAAGIATECHRIRYALTFVTGATDTTDRCTVCKVEWVDTADGVDTCAGCQASA